MRISHLGARHGLLALALLVTAMATVVDAQPALDLEDCRLDGASVPARCGALTVFEDRATDAGRTIDLKIVVIPAVSGSPEPDPLFFLAGGPGQAATDLAERVLARLAEVRRSRDIVVVEPPDDPEAAVRDGDLDLVLIIDEDYGQHFRSVQPATVRLVHDSSRTASSSSIRRARNLLREYSNQVAVLRLIARGVSPGVMQAVRVDELDLATPAQSAARLFVMLPMFLILAAFVGGLNVAIDTTAGERERHSLEPLLVNPVSRTALTAGKWLTTCLFGLVASILTLVAFLFMMRFVPLEQLGMQLNLEYRQLLLMTIAVAPMALFASALQMFVATFARSFKEAQTYVSVLIFLPMIPGMVTQIYPLQPAGWMMAVPALAQQLLLVDVMGGEPVSTLGLLGSAAATTVLAFLFLVSTSRMLRQEKIIFGRT